MRFGLWPLVLCGVVRLQRGRLRLRGPGHPARGAGPGAISAAPAAPAEEGLAITAISPTELVEGGTATITGHGFKSFASLNSVLIGGTAATVTASTATELRITVPALCRPTGPVEVRVRVGTASADPVSHPLRSSAEPVQLAPGAMAVVGAPDPYCLQFGH
ncbi:MAG: IPT/TIG domain-containing protein, partial [Gemmatimonadota bacterium]